jgi:hypothetical protein
MANSSGRTFLRSIGVSALGLACGCANRFPADTPMAESLGQKPNIVIINANDLGWGDLSCYNAGSRIRTPAIDRFAEQGMLFTDAHSTASVCTPSRYSLLTGRGAIAEGEFLPCALVRQKAASVGMNVGVATAGNILQHFLEARAVVVDCPEVDGFVEHFHVG